LEPEIALHNLRLINRDSEVTNACVWLLAKNIQDFNISADVSCTLFMGTTKVHILDQRDFQSDIYSMINSTVAWILSKINVEYIIEKLQREECPEFPEAAIREAIVNAFVHRNYRSSGNIQVYVFSDRLEIVSPGGLPTGMTESDLGISSVPRNPLLFSILHRMDAVERIGSGIHRIRVLCREYKIDEPKFTITENFVIVTFFRSQSSRSKQELSFSGHESSRVETESNQSSDIEGIKLDIEGTKLDIEGTKLDIEGTKLDTEGTKLDTEGTKLDIEGTKLDTEGTKLFLKRDQVKTIHECEHEKTAGELMNAVGRNNRSKFQKTVLKPLIHAELIEMTIPDKPHSRNQKYRLTQKGKDLLYNL